MKTFCLTLKRLVYVNPASPVFYLYLLGTCIVTSRNLALTQQVGVAAQHLSGLC